MSADPAARKAAVYGEIDLNLVDGSSIWIQSICEVLRAAGDMQVTLLLRRSVEPDRRFLFEELERSGFVEVIDPQLQAGLDPGQALDLLEDLDRERGPFDLVLLRGAGVLAEVASRSAFDDRLWPYVMTGRGLADETLRALVSRSARLLCQTDAAAEELREIAPAAGGSVLVLPPMIPDSRLQPRLAGGDRPLRLVYSGKLAPEYCWLETVAAFAALRDSQPGTELHVLGDKIHRPPAHPDFHDEAMRTLRETENLRWHGAVPRVAVQALLADCDLALSVRDPSVDGAREISTKVLEYGAAGLPVVLNRAPVYEGLLGADYPLFVDGPEEAAAALAGPALDPELRAVAARACHAASADFTFARVGARLARQLPGSPTGVQGPPAQPVERVGGPEPRVLVAGHNLKFLDPVRRAVASAGGTLTEDVWDNHTRHSEPASRSALAAADVVLCEWCLGNASWYSRNLPPGRRLAVRFHRMELETNHPAGVDLDAVDAMVFVSRHVLEEAAARFGWEGERLRVIPNAIDCERLLRPKSPAARSTLALIGYAPSLKRLDRALDLLEELRRREPRFRLVVVGRPPSDFGWIVGRAEEVDAFRRCYARIHDSSLLRGAVEFLPFTTDLPSLFERVGWIVSVSDVEGHQVTLAEGAASGAVPVVLDRPGARDQYPDRWVHATVAEAAVAVAGLSAAELASEGTAAADHAARWSYPRILPLWLDALGLDGSGVAVDKGDLLDRVGGQLQPQR